MLIAAPPPRCTPGVLSTMSSGTAGAAVASGDAQELRTHAAGAQARSARPGIASSHGPTIQLGSRRPKGRRRQHARQDQPQPSMWLSSQRRRRSPSGCSGRLGGADVPVSHVPSGCMAVRIMALPRRRRLSPRVHHITTTSPPPARRQPTHTRVELTCIFTAHTTHTQRTHVTACHTQPASTPMPVPQLTPFSCLRAALARQDLLATHRGRRDPWFVLPAS